MFGEGVRDSTTCTKKIAAKATAHAPVETFFGGPYYKKADKPEEKNSLVTRQGDVQIPTVLQGNN